VGDAPPEPELLLDDALLDDALLDDALLDDALLDDAPVDDALLDDALPPVPPTPAVLDPPAPPPPALLLEELELTLDPVVEVCTELDVELAEESPPPDPPPVPSSLPAAQLVGNAATKTTPTPMSARETTRRPTLARPDAKNDRGNMGRSSTRKPEVRLRPRASGEPDRDWCSVPACGPRAAREAAGGGK
jgi:hypothetical protein